MLENGLYTPKGVLIGQAVILPNGQAAIRVKRPSKEGYDAIALSDLIVQIKSILKI